MTDSDDNEVIKWTNQSHDSRSCEWGSDGLLQQASAAVNHAHIKGHSHYSVAVRAANI